MDFNTYLSLSSKTMSDQFHYDTQVTDLLHCILGILTEIDEIDESTDVINFKEELGDVWWYIAIAYRTLRIPEENHVMKINDLKLMLEYESFLESSLNYKAKYCKDQVLPVAFKAVDQLKKKLYYNKPIDLEQFKEHITVITAHIACLSLITGLDITNIFDVNIAKLKARYGDKFTSEAAINRNLDLEYQVLSSN